MKKFSIQIVFLSACIAYIFLLSNRSGSIAGMTGAPGEDTCGRSSCHNAMPNQGNAMVKIEVDDSLSAYTPDAIHKVKISIEDAKNPNRNGFEIVALNNQEQNIGEWILSGNDIRGRSGNGRSYVTQTSEGSGQSSWEIDWKAPPASSGNITFYLAYNDADGNGGRTGDDIYTQSLSLREGNISTSINEIPGLDNINLYPNPVQEQFTIDLDMSKAGELKGILVNTLGQPIQQLFNQSLPSGNNRIDLTINPNLTSGRYYLHIFDKNNSAQTLPIIKL